MPSAGTLIFQLAADVSRLSTDMRKAQETVKSSLDSIAKSSEIIAAKAGYDFASGFARAFADRIKAAIDQADAMGKLAQRIGTTTEQLSALTYAGKFADVSTDDLTTAFKGLNKALLDARDPANASAVAIRALGLNVKQLQAEDPAKAFEDIAEAMSHYRDGAEKAAVAQQLFGKQGTALIPLLNEGKEGLEAARKEAESLGLIVSSQTAQAMGDLNDDFTRLGNVAEGAFAIIARSLGPALDNLVTTLSGATQEGNAFKEVLDFIGTTISDLILDLTQLAGEIEIAWTELKGYGKAASEFFAGEFKQSLDTARQAMDQSNASMDALIAKTGKAKALQREMQQNPIDLGNPAAGWDDKPVVKFTAGLDNVAKAAKHAKAATDEFKVMLDGLNEQMRKLAAQGDPFKEFLSDPKLLALPKQQQQVLIDLARRYYDLKDALDAQHKAEDDERKAQQDALDELIARKQAVEAYAEQVRMSVDPVHAYVEEIKKLTEAQQQGALDAADFAKAQQQAAEKLQQAMGIVDPMKDRFKDLMNAIEGFGKQASDALVGFAFSTKDASTSFSDMISSMLQDLAKMLVYQNVFKPMFSAIGSYAGGMGGSGGFGGLFGSLFGGGLMAGGPVSPGHVYAVNEVPGRKEFFIPHVGGNVMTDAGGAMGSGGNVTVNVNMHKDGSSTDDTKADDRKAAELGKRIAAVVKATIASEKRTGGLLDPTGRA